MQIIVYSTTTCPYCKMLKDYLQANNVSFSEKLVDVDEAARTEMVESSKGFLGVPFTIIIKDDGSKETVLGFDKGKLNSMLGIG
jgi:glutaredoxin 3